MTATNKKLIEVERDLTATAQAKAKVIAQYLLPDAVVPKLVIQSKKGVIYILTGDNAKPIPKQQLRRKDKHLEVEVDGQVVLELRDFFAPDQSQPEGALYWVDGTVLETGGIFISAETPTSAADGTIFWNAGVSDSPLNDDVVALAPAAIGINPLVGALAAGGAVGAAAGGGGGGGAATAGSVGTPNASSAALTKIAAYAATSTDQPTLADYLAIGLTGVNSNNLSAINSAIKAQRGKDDADGDADDREAADTPAKVQAIIDAYNIILAAADGLLDGDSQPTQAHYSTLGITGIDLLSEISLLGSVIDGKASTEVDTVAELQDLANRVDFFLGVAAKANDTYSGALPTAADWAALLVSGVNPENLSRMNSILYATDGDGADAYTTADFDTVAEIQDWVNVFTNPPVM